jgi:hypothetical protein
MLGSTAKTLADSTANSAVVAAIAPICVDQFQRGADAANGGFPKRDVHRRELQWPLNVDSDRPPC